MKIKVQTKNLTLVKTQETKEDSNGCLELAEKRRLASWSVENFKGKKTTFFIIPQLGPYIIIDLSKPIEYVTPRMSPNITLGFGWR